MRENGWDYEVQKEKDLLLATKVDIIFTEKHYECKEEQIPVQRNPKLEEIWNDVFGIESNKNSEIVHTIRRPVRHIGTEQELRSYLIVLGIAVPLPWETSKISWGRVR